MKQRALILAIAAVVLFSAAAAVQTPAGPADDPVVDEIIAIGTAEIRDGLIAGLARLETIKTGDPIRSIRIVRVGQTAQDFKTDGEAFRKLLETEKDE